ncbi:DUF1028 domain-containing protein [Ktedonospora formicarum]|uniref:Putative peptidoglycan binding domain-containing protein n=1 Tax=Ktedonospora formicarum TaxID=2778364 RepID=A0A8J3I274_9CHLR|nr:DUF1028 domain-containing protein [Ktedonospora formicarum]GHO43554.1 hypothetical protein KSX_17170 [Ktedonospora formicarum]
MTYSIVARDLTRGEIGIAVQSKFLSVGAVVPWAKAGVGAIATQALANTSYGPRGLEHLAAGHSAEETLDYLLAHDEGQADRQVGIIGLTGKPTTFTGKRCFNWAGGLVGEHYACQGNILVSGDTVQTMAHTFEGTQGLLCDRLLAALAAGQAAGGDGRGQQSAALLVVKEHGGYGGYTDRFIDLRVDDHQTPIEELKRLLELHKLYLFPPNPEDILTIDTSLAYELQQLLTITGDYHNTPSKHYDETTREAFRAFSGRENLEERWFEDKRLDTVVLNFLRQKVQEQSAS